MVFSTCFLLAWVQIYLAAEHWRYEYYPVDGSASVYAGDVVPAGSARPDTEAVVVVDYEE